MSEKHCRAWNMPRKLKIVENEKHTVGSEIWRETLQNVKNQKCTLQELEYGEKTKHTVRM